MKYQRFWRTTTIFSFLIFVALFAFFSVTSAAPAAQTQEKPGGGQAKTDQSQEKAEPESAPDLPAFGYDIFRPLDEPIVEGPVDDEYLISPGDEIVIKIWGQLNLDLALTVTEDGYIELPEGGGRIYVSGVSLRELRSVVTRSLSRLYSSYINADSPSQSTAFVDVRLAKIRKLLVYVMGEVQKQGAFGISSTVATLINCLTNAEGVKPTGSLREIMIRRANGMTETVDLYDFLLTGKLDTRKSRIRYGDYIIVPLKAKSVTIKGEIRRPGVYEMVRAEGVRDLVRFAGGLAPNAYQKRAQVRRFETGAGEKFIDINLEPILSSAGSPDFILSNGDEVTIFPTVLVRRRMVEVKGDGIKRPGIYEYRPGMTIRDLIDAAEGLKEYVHLERADFIRTAEDFSKKMSTFSLAELYKETEPGKYVFYGVPAKNFALKEMDEVVVYSSFKMRGGDKRVTIEGHVKEPGTYILASGMKLYDLIFSRGGFTDEDFKKHAYLELAHIFRKVPGEFEERIINFNLGKLLDGSQEENLALEDGDRVRIYSYETMEAKPYVQIEGLIKRPSSYPMAEGMTLEDLILVAGGLRPEAYKVEAVIARTARTESGSRSGHEAPEQMTISTFIVPIEKDFALLPQENKTKLEAFDRIVVRNQPGWEPLPVVSILGEVLYPGNYALDSRDERLSSVVRRAGGIKKGGYAEGAHILRRTDIVAMSSKISETLQRIAINLRQALENPGGASDLVLKDGDQIFIPLDPGTVEIRGAVRNPGLFQFKKGQSLNRYIEQSGGYIPSADRGAVTVFLPNGTAVRKGGLFGGQVRVLAGSVIDVPYREEIVPPTFVRVQGAVARPALVQWLKGKRLYYYLELCGGLAENADPDRITVIAPDGTLSESGKDPFFNPFVPEGAIIRIPIKETAPQESGTETKK